MRPQRKKRLIFVFLIVLGISAAAALGLSAFQENLLYFYTPSKSPKARHPRAVPSASADWSRRQRHARIRRTDRAFHSDRHGQEHSNHL